MKDPYNQRLTTLKAQNRIFEFFNSSLEFKYFFEDRKKNKFSFHNILFLNIFSTEDNPI